MDTDPNILQWLYVTIVAPVLGWLGGWLHSLRGAKRRKKSRIKFLCGLPPEAKAKLINFNYQGTHTLRGDPGAPDVWVSPNFTDTLLSLDSVFQTLPG